MSGLLSLSLYTEFMLDYLRCLEMSYVVLHVGSKIRISIASHYRWFFLNEKRICLHCPTSEFFNEKRNIFSGEKKQLS